jgi:hypothetical protein
MTYIQNHLGWIIGLIAYLSVIAWITYEAHIAPTEEQDPTDITIDDLIN